MVVPIAARDVAAGVGALLVVTAAISEIGTLIVPRPIGSWLTRLVDRLVTGAFRVATGAITHYRRRSDRAIPRSPPRPPITGGATGCWPRRPPRSCSPSWPPGWGCSSSATRCCCGPSPPTSPRPSPRPARRCGYRLLHRARRGEHAIQDIASLTGIITVTLQIAYLPTLYSAFNRRENEVALLNARAGVPSWGPELLARSHYALGSGVSTIDTLPDLYERWERGAADVAESHATYLPLVRFRSPKPLSSWVTALLAVLDSAALFLALSPEEAPVVAARLCLRSGLLCFNEVARAMGIEIPDMPDRAAGITLRYNEFLDAIAGCGRWISRSSAPPSRPGRTSSAGG